MFATNVQGKGTQKACRTLVKPYVATFSGL